MGYNKIVCVEPDPKNFLQLQNNYKNDTTITLINKAVTDKSNDIVQLHSTRNLPFLNSLSKEWITETRHAQFYRPNQYDKVDVETITIRDIVELVGKTPDYIKIDVEGSEALVIRCIDFKPELLSFEWISEKLEDNLSCMSLLLNLGFSKFYICSGEYLPDKNDVCFTYTECCIRFFELYKSDNKNIFGGNCFCL
jgi:FkbM family methyltransferase